jgi:hypothetical protein
MIMYKMEPWGIEECDKLVPLITDHPVLWQIYYIGYRYINYDRCVLATLTPR